LNCHCLPKVCYTDLASFEKPSLIADLSCARINLLTKGVKVFDYDNTITTVLEFADCMNIVNFVNNLDPTDKVDIYRRIPGRFDKSIVLQWNVKDDVIQNAVMYFNMSQNGVETKVMIPFGVKILLEFAKVIESYMNNMPMIKLFCNGIEGEYEKKSFTNTSAPSGNPDVEDSDY
jgi:hypothetical protein